jgi:hypothetical protein
MCPARSWPSRILDLLKIEDEDSKYHFKPNLLDRVMKDETSSVREDISFL